MLQLSEFNFVRCYINYSGCDHNINHTFQMKLSLLQANFLKQWRIFSKILICVCVWIAIGAPFYYSCCPGNRRHTDVGQDCGAQGKNLWKAAGHSWVSPEVSSNTKICWRRGVPNTPGLLLLVVEAELSAEVLGRARRSCPIWSYIAACIRARKIDFGGT